jgi:ankyrin repeat protein
MKLSFKDSFGKIAGKDISHLEQKIGHRLPLDYISFLLKNNGGRPKLDVFQTKYGEYTSDIQFFYGITERDIYDLGTKYHFFQDRLPKQFLTIATNSYGDLILMNLEDERIFFFDHETEETVLAADSFPEFLDSLYELEREESELDKAVNTQNLEYFKKLLDKKTDINSLVNESNQPVTIVAALANKLKLLKFFIQNGAAYNGALFSAASNGHLSVVKYLLSIGADPNERDATQNNDTALLQACHGGHLEMVKALL